MGSSAYFWGFIPLIFFLGWLPGVLAIVFGVLGRKSPRPAMAGWGIGLGVGALVTGLTIGLIAAGTEVTGESGEIGSGTGGSANRKPFCGSKEEAKLQRYESKMGDFLNEPKKLKLVTDKTLALTARAEADDLLCKLGARLPRVVLGWDGGDRRAKPFNPRRQADHIRRFQRKHHLTP